MLDFWSLVFFSSFFPSLALCLLDALVLMRLLDGTNCFLRFVTSSARMMIFCYSGVLVLQSSLIFNVLYLLIANVMSFS